MREEKGLRRSRCKLIGVFIAFLCVTMTLVEIWGNTATSPEPSYKPMVRVTGASHIFTGTVLSIESRWVNEREHREINNLNESRPANESNMVAIYSWAKIEVEQYIEGDGPQVVTVIYEGGCVGNTSVICMYGGIRFPDGTVYPGGMIYLEIGEKVKVYAKLVDPEENLFKTSYVQHQKEDGSYSPWNP